MNTFSRTPEIVLKSGRRFYLTVYLNLRNPPTNYFIGRRFPSLFLVLSNENADFFFSPTDWLAPKLEHGEKRRIRIRRFVNSAVWYTTKIVFADEATRFNTTSVSSTRRFLTRSKAAWFRKHSKTNKNSWGQFFKQKSCGIEMAVRKSWDLWVYKQKIILTQATYLLGTAIAKPEHLCLKNRPQEPILFT